MKLLFRTIVIFIAFSTTAANVFLNELEKGVECTEVGFICDGCDASYYCFFNGDGFEAEKLEDCTDGHTCLAITGRCTDLNPICTGNYTFACHQKGIFPDPYKCNKYHICCSDFESEPYTNECPLGFKFNPLNALCDKKMDTCEPLLPLCYNAGISGPVPGHPSMYYICLYTDSVLLPNLFLCPTNYIYADDKCVDPDGFTFIEVAKLIEKPL